MAYDDTLFRAQFPEFSDPTKYPEVLLSAYWDMANDFIAYDGSPCSMLGLSGPLALNYMTAHLLSMGIVASQAMSGVNGAPAQGGFEDSASIDKISVHKVAPPAKDAWGYFLSQTVYGQALLALLSVKGVGGLSVGGLPEGDAFRRVGGVWGNLGNGVFW